MFVAESTRRHYPCAAQQVPEGFTKSLSVGTVYRLQDRIPFLRATWKLFEAYYAIV